jgi:membrane protein YqaA with SNARE-associated domain
VSVFVFFLISETFLGLLPPEFFIAWASKASSPWIFLFILATISYTGGIASYLIGVMISNIPSVKNYLENKVKMHIANLRKWGGFFIFVGATLPIPHSVISMASGLIRYNFGNYLLWALFRYLRFGLYAIVIFRLL